MPWRWSCRSLYFQQQDADQRECTARQVETIGKIFVKRAGIAEEESQATRTIIRRALTAKDQAALEQARDDYFLSLGAIDSARDRAKVPDFPAGTCDQ